MTKELANVVETSRTASLDSVRLFRFCIRAALLNRMKDASGTLLLVPSDFRAAANTQVRIEIGAFTNREIIRFDFAGKTRAGPKDN